MSMTSGQCDELREKAKLLRGHVDGLSAPYVIPSTKELMALTMLDSADRMERAADTILELREMAQKANAENVKLRELACAAWRCIHTGASCSDCRLIAGGCTLQSAMRKLGIELDS